MEALNYSVFLPQGIFVLEPILNIISYYIINFYVAVR